MSKNSCLTFIVVLCIILSFLIIDSYLLDDSLAEDASTTDAASVGVPYKTDNVVLKVLIVNPSKTLKKTYIFKYYLPQEIKPEDVLDKGELALDYDAGRDLSYVHKDFVLEPSQTIALQIVIRNVWNIPQAEIDSIRSELTNLAPLMDQTEFKERVDFLRDSIESKLKIIIAREAQPADSADRYILNFRDNQRILDTVKSDLSALKSILSQTEIPISSASTWKLILGITIFLGISSVIFLFVWSRQIKGTAAKEDNISKESVITAEKREAEEEKKVELKDIEDRLKG